MDDNQVDYEGSMGRVRRSLNHLWFFQPSTLCVYPCIDL